MKGARTKFVLAASIALNIALLVAAVFQHHERATKRSFSRTLRTPVAPESHFSKPAVGGTLQPAPRTIWEALDKRDPAELTASLRSIGCPEQTIREILVFRISREYRKALMAFEDAHFAAWNYWEPQDTSYSTERSRLNRQLREQRNSTLEALLGGDAQKILNQLIGWSEREDRRGFLPENKKKALAALEQRYQSLEEEWRFNRGVYLKTGDGDPAAQKELARLKSERRAEIAALLSPDELQELDLRESPAADYVRQNSPEPKSEEEYRRTVKAVLDTGLVQKPPHEEMLERYGVGDSEELKERNRQEQEREQVLQERIKGVVGAERIEERDRLNTEKQWEEGRERFRSELNALGDGLNIDSARLDALLDQIKPILIDLQTKTRTSATDEERSQIERAIKEQVDQRVLETLGEAGPEFVARWNRKLEDARKR